MLKFQKSFTLTERVVATAIIVILIAVIAPNAFKAIEKAKIISCAKTLKVIKKAALNYYADTGIWTSSPENKVCYVPNDNISWDKSLFYLDSAVIGWDGPYLRQEIKSNPWGGKYNYMVLSSSVIFGDPTTERTVVTTIGDASSENMIDQFMDDGDTNGGLVRKHAFPNGVALNEDSIPRVFFLISRDGAID